MYDDIITLKGNRTITYDSAGNEIITYEDRTVYAIPRGIYSSEFYQAAQLGLHPSITFQISTRGDYQGEKLLEYNGELYAVVRVDWDAQRDAVRLICEERVGNE